MEFVRRERQHIDVVRLHVDGNVADGLDGVRMESDLLCAADGAYLLNGEDGAHLVVGVHNCNKSRVGADGLLHLRGGYESVAVDGQISHLETLAFELFESVKDGVVFEVGGYNVLFALGRAVICGRAYGLVVRLAPAGREINFARGCT